MIVPIDAWNKMLNQLGNLHEAGQQLAEARERAAKAETEALFLRERLTELRGAVDPPAPSAPSPPAEAETEPPPSPPVSSPLGGRGVRDHVLEQGSPASGLGPVASGSGTAADGGGYPLAKEEAASAESERPGVATVLWRYVRDSWKSRRR